MTTLPHNRKQRASPATVRSYLKVAREAGLTVDKMCIDGGKVEIHFADLESPRSPIDDGDLEKW
ncbi:hypothetical protein FJU08_17415 [Martelella alba]|uniref:Uncharacterized protein n=1 Tax=Martelella alba TaxID=2590451 RepID=A0A506U2J0_9HYPH|nr:hypothetical protein [Martelella alba]TPW28582.1 hypothetical protein FJU08_17415 [Martelella alba]